MTAPHPDSSQPTAIDVDATTVRGATAAINPLSDTAVAGRTRNGPADLPERWARAFTGVEVDLRIRDMRDE